MKPLLTTILPLLCLLAASPLHAQVDEDQLGGWYSWFYNRNISESNWATQMIIQSRNWDVAANDLQQRLVLGLASVKPDGHPVRYGFGYYHLRSGDFGPAANTRDSHVLFQQGLYTAVQGERNYWTLRLRLEEHWPDGRNDFRRLRAYASVNRPLNRATLENGALYLSLYDEYFVDLDRVNYALNRAYAGIGWKMTDHTSWQFGVMRQNGKAFNKNQLMVHLFHHY